jgi:flagellar motility protein MotE (MotC chaperone)
MSRTFRALGSVALAAVFAVNSFGQTPDPPKRTKKPAAAAQKTKSTNTSTKDTSEQLKALQGRLDQAQTQIQQQQTQIEKLQNSLQDSVRLMQQQQQQLQLSVQKASEEASVPRNTAALAHTEVTSVKSSVASVSESVQAQDTRVKSLEAPTTIHYKGVTLTPGGFLEATALVRTHNENADISNSYTGIPLNGTSNSKLSEFRGAARDSRLSLLVQANAGRTKLSGYVEGDFLGAAPTANFVQASSFTPRLRQAFVQINKDSGWTVTAGQFWSLMTTDRQGLATRAEFIPNTADGSFVVGFTWVRERSVRVAKDFHNGIWAAFEVDDPESTYSAAFVPQNIMGLNTSQNASTGVLLLPYR